MVNRVAGTQIRIHMVSIYEPYHIFKNLDQHCDIVKSLSVTLTLCSGTSFCLGCSVSIQLSAYVPEIAVEGDLSVWASVAHLGDLDKAPGACLHPGPALKGVFIWELN